MKVVSNNNYTELDIPKIEEILNSISSFEEKSRFTKSTYEISYEFQFLKNNTGDASGLKRICFLSIERVFLNKSFLNNIKLYIDDSNKDKVSRTESGVFIKAALELAFFPLAIFLKEFNEQDVSELKEVLKQNLNTLNKEIRNNKTIYYYLDLFGQIVNRKEFSSKEKTDRYIDFKFFLETRFLSYKLIKMISIEFLSGKFLEVEFKEIEKNHVEMENFSVWIALSKIYARIRRRDLIISNILKGDDSVRVFYELFKNQNIINSIYIIGEFLKGFDLSIKEKTIDQAIIEQIEKSTQLKASILTFCYKNFKAYSGLLNDDCTEWSNKIFIKTNKTLSTFEVLKEAKDFGWVSAVFRYELFKWIKDIYLILNKHEIEDDWSKIEQYLIEENNTVEWKSTFLTSTESLFENEKREVENSKVMLKIVAEAILGMINTEGGTILVGLVENPEKVKREDIKRMFLVKNKFTFFDIKYEFEKRNISSLDYLKRKIQDELCNGVNCGLETFNNMWFIQPIEIKNGEKSATIFKIDVKKSEKPIFSIDPTRSWVTLIKRADGRTIKTNPANLFK